MSTSELNDEQLLALMRRHYARPLEHTLGKEPAALLCIDMQNRNSDPSFGHGPTAAEKGLSGILDPFYERLRATVLPNVKQLQEAARNSGTEVIHFRVACHTRDGRDHSRRYMSMGIRSSSDDLEAQIHPQVAPVDDELIFDKVTSSGFESTNVDRVLRNLGVQTVIVCGLVTNGCVQSTARSASDRDYRVVVAEDACTALEPRLHRAALLNMRLSAAVALPTDDIIKLLASTPKGEPVVHNHAATHP